MPDKALTNIDLQVSTQMVQDVATEQATYFTKTGRYTNILGKYSGAEVMGYSTVKGVGYIVVERKEGLVRIVNVGPGEFLACDWFKPQY